MKKYEVAIKATVTKTLTVNARTEDEAVEIAHEIFTVECEGDDEDYKQETVHVS